MESPEHEEQAVREYLASQFDLLDDVGAVTHAEKVASEAFHGQTYDVWDVHTRADGRWWVVTCPMNYYTQDDFKSVDVVLSFSCRLDGAGHGAVEAKRPSTSSTRGRAPDRDVAAMAAGR